MQDLICTKIHKDILFYYQQRKTWFNARLFTFHKHHLSDITYHILYHL